MSKLYVITSMILILGIAALAGACAAAPQSSPPKTVPAAPAPTPTPTPAPAQPALLTVGRLAEPGGLTLKAACAGCHGDSGQGGRAPAIIGANAQLTKYNNAKGLFTFISTTMPMNAPGRLTQQEYLQVLSFILLQNNFATASTAIDPNQLESLVLKK